MFILQKTFRNWPESSISFGVIVEIEILTCIMTGQVISANHRKGNTKLTQKNSNTSWRNMGGEFD